MSSFCLMCSGDVSFNQRSRNTNPDSAVSEQRPQELSNECACGVLDWGQISVSNMTNNNYIISSLFIRGTTDHHYVRGEFKRSLEI